MFFILSCPVSFVRSFSFYLFCCFGLAVAGEGRTEKGGNRGLASAVERPIVSEIGVSFVKMRILRILRRVDPSSLVFARSWVDRGEKVCPFHEMDGVLPGPRNPHVIWRLSVYGWRW